MKFDPVFILIVVALIALITTNRVNRNIRLILMGLWVIASVLAIKFDVVTGLFVLGLGVVSFRNEIASLWNVKGGAK